MAYIALIKRVIKLNSLLFSTKKCTLSVLMNTHNICFCGGIRKKYRYILKNKNVKR